MTLPVEAMNIDSIKSDREYRRMLKEIDKRMDAKANTAAGDQLDVLATMAEAWEEKHHPIEAPNPN
jgi:HTH-type transcriptional regulator/antitoxin HigA